MIQSLRHRQLHCLLLAAAISAAAHADGFSVEKLADGVYAHRGVQADATAANRGDIANIGFVVGDDCVAVVDTGGTRIIGKEFLGAIRRITPNRICYVINTHIHPDHVFGNDAFVAEGTRFVGHMHAPAAMAARQQSYLASLADQVGKEAAQGSILIPPTELVAADTDKMLDLGGRSVVVHAWATSHTDADVTVLDVKTGTLFTGDLLFVERIPVIDGSLLGWLKTLSALAALTPKHVVPGHGPIDPPWQPALSSEKRYLDTIARDVRDALKVNKTLQQTVDQAGVTEHDQWKLFEDYNRRNVTAAYTELEWEN